MQREYTKKKNIQREDIYKKETYTEKVSIRSRDR